MEPSSQEVSEEWLEMNTEQLRKRVETAEADADRLAEELSRWGWLLGQKQRFHTVEEALDAHADALEVRLTV